MVGILGGAAAREVPILLYVSKPSKQIYFSKLDLSSFSLITSLFLFGVNRCCLLRKFMQCFQNMCLLDIFFTDFRWLDQERTPCIHWRYMILRKDWVLVSENNLLVLSLFFFKWDNGKFFQLLEPWFTHWKTVYNHVAEPWQSAIATVFSPSKQLAWHRKEQVYFFKVNVKT